MYYDFAELEKKDALYNYIVTPRGAGKTFSMKNRMVEKFVNEGKRFVYIRRRDVELTNKKMTEFFVKFQNEGFQTGHELKCEGGTFYCDGKVMGWGVALSTSHNERSVDFINISDIYFEEFIIKRGSNLDYLEDEVTKFLDLYSTIARNSVVKAWFLGNRFHDFNPYFMYFDLIPPKGNGIKKFKDHAIEFWARKEFIEEKKKTRFGQLIDGTPYGAYAMENIALEESDNFISPMSKRAQPIMVIWSGGKWYNVFKDYMTGKVYVSDTRKISKNVKVLEITDNEKMESNKIIGVRDARMSNNMMFTAYRRAITKNMIYYTSPMAKEGCRVINKKIYFG